MLRSGVRLLRSHHSGKDVRAIRGWGPSGPFRFGAEPADAVAGREAHHGNGAQPSESLREASAARPKERLSAAVDPAPRLRRGFGPTEGAGGLVQARVPDGEDIRLGRGPRILILFLLVSIIRWAHVTEEAQVAHRAHKPVGALLASELPAPKQGVMEEDGLLHQEGCFPAEGTWSLQTRKQAGAGRR